MDQRTLTRRLWVVLSSVLAGFIVVTLFSLYGLELALMKEKQQQTQHLVENAYTLMAHYHELQQNGTLTEIEAKDRAVDALASMRYESGNYYWIHDLQSRMVMHPHNEELLGIDLNEVADKSGKYVFREMQKLLLSSGEGVVSYVWSKPGQTDPADKVSFVKLFQPWGWAIGSGVYTDDVHEAFSKSAIFLISISSSVVLMVITAGFLIRRENLFQKNFLEVSEQNNKQLKIEIERQTRDLSNAYEEIKDSQQKAIDDKRRIEYSEALFRGMASAAQDAMILIDKEGDVRYWNLAATRIFGYSKPEAEGKQLHSLIFTGGGRKRFLNAFPYLQKVGQKNEIGAVVEANWITKSGGYLPVELSINSVWLENEWQAICIVRDITERKKIDHELRKQSNDQQVLINELKSTQDQLIQSEKMAAIGQLSAGVAHEINNPMGFIESNLKMLESYLNDLIEMYTEAKKAFTSNSLSVDEIERISSIENQYDFDFLRKDYSEVFNETQEGIERIRRIISGLKGFSRTSADAMEAADINAEIDTTLNIVWNELKYHCEIEKQYAPLPKVECLSSEIGQVVMNLLMNASHAIEEKGVIRIRTLHDGDWIRIEVSDTGKGISAEQLSRIFDPFFTTKPIGKGTGLGLSVSYGIIEKHQGKLTVESTVGEGSTFTVRLPVNQAIVEKVEV